MSGTIVPWIDLLAAAAWPARQGALALVASPRLHTMPLLERQGTVAWLQSTRWADFTALPHQMPAPRARYSLTEHAPEVGELLHRAALVVMEVGDVEVGGDVSAPLAAWLRAPNLPAKRGLIYGRTEAPGWANEAVQTALQATAHRWRPLPAPEGWRALVSAELWAGRGRLGLREPTLDRALAQHLYGQVARRADTLLDAQRVPERARLRLRLRPPPITCVATLSPAQQHHITARGQALFGPRGGCSVLLPWGAPLAARFLVRNTARWAYDITAAMGSRQLQALTVQSIEQGLVMDFELPAPEPGCDALLHLSLPRAALPLKGFCELAAVEFTVELT